MGLNIYIFPYAQSTFQPPKENMVRFVRYQAITIYKLQKMSQLIAQGQRQISLVPRLAFEEETFKVNPNMKSPV